MMKDIISRAMSSGLDFTSGGALKSFLNRFEIDEELYDKTYVKIKNMAFESEFKETPNSKIIIFLPQCLRDSQDCEADLTDEGYVCNRCGNCVIDEVFELAERHEYKGVYIVPGGSMVRKIMKEYEPEAVIGVGCYPELVEAMEFSSVYNIPPQGVSLTKAGCKDTEMNKEELFKVIRKDY